MLERLVGRLLNNVLSKFFVHQSSSDEAAAEGAPSLGVWSGFIALDNLRLKTEVVNNILQEQGLPFEVLHCTIRRVEITVPWSKLRTTGLSSAASASTGENGAVVVVVMDGIHVLARTLYEFQDDKMRQKYVDQRRKKLQEAQTFEEKPTTPETSESWFSLGNMKDFVQKQISKGLLQQVADKLHIHIRDLHIRLEDAETDPVHPCACGFIMESMHVQHREEEPTTAGEEDDHDEFFPGEKYAQKETDVIRKVAQVNHCAVYWNALGYEDGLPLEHSVLHQLPSLNSPELIAAALDRGIARRVTSSWSSPGGRVVMPTHHYLLLPVDCSLNGVLAVDTTNGGKKVPSMSINLHVESINVQLRDFQCRQILLLVHTIQQHNFTKPYRRFRPQVSVLESPKAWWKYAFRVVSSELKGSRLRWSWGRMRQCYAGRYRYCELYERKLKHSFVRRNSSTNNLSALVEETFDSTPDDGAGPSLQNDTNSIGSLELSHPQENGPLQRLPQEHDAPQRLSLEEAQELQNLEDGILGDMSIDDILLYRLLVHGRLGYEAQRQAAVVQSFSESWIFGNQMVQNAIRDDIECQQEVQRLMAYMEHSSTEDEAQESSTQNLQTIIFLSVRLHWNEGCLAVFSPLPSTAQEPSLLRRLHERFLDFTFDKLTLGFTLMGDFQTFSVHASLLDYTITEIRSNRQKFAILFRRNPCETDVISSNTVPQSPSRRKVSFSGEEGLNDTHLKKTPPKSPLLFADVHRSPAVSPLIKAKLEAVEVVLVPECQWIGRLKEFLQHCKPSGLGKLSDYWKGLNYASINAWASTRLGLQAKAEAALEGHTSLILDIDVDCPVIQIVGEGKKQVWIDLGRAHLKTIKLAGVAAMDLNRRESRTDDSKRRDGRNGSSTNGSKNLSNAFEQVASAFEGSDRSLGHDLIATSYDSESFLLRPTTPVSFDNQTTASYAKRGQRLGALSVRSGSGHHGDGSSTVAKQEGEIQSSFFYDVYQLQIKTGDAVVGEWCEVRQGVTVADLEDPVLGGFHIRVNLHKSIIPADHTLCRFRLDCIIDEVCTAMSPKSLVYMSSILRTWKTVLSDPPAHRTLVISAFSDQTVRPARTLTLVEPTEELDSRELQLESVGSGSQVDDQEFFDAVEHDDQSDNMSVWLEDNWIADADSVLSGDRHSATPRQRRNKAAMSDVSSLSDRSLKKMRRPKESTAYLNEENLAMLEEGIGEEESLDTDNDSASFHSAMTPSHLTDLISELDKSIGETRDSLGVLKAKVDEISTNTNGQSQGSLTSDSTKQRRLLKRSLRIEQERLRAELNELIATRHDLTVQLTALDDGTDNSVAKTIGTNGYHAPARRASLLLTSRKGHEKTFDAMQHNLTRNLNPQLFQCTLAISKISFKFCGVEDVDGVDDNGSLDVNFCISNGTLAVRHSENETKALLSVENVLASYSSSNSTESQRMVLIGGSQYSLASTLLPLHFPQYVSSVSVEDKFIKCTLELRHRPATKHSLKSPEIIRLRVVVGDLEATPEPRLLKALASCHSKTMSDIDKPIGEARSDGAVMKKEARSGPAYLDLSIQCSSVGMIFLHGDTAVAALALTELGAKLAMSSAKVAYKGRRQLDFRCTNAQVLHIEDLHLGKGSEVLGRRDPYLPLVQVRLRSQLVPSSDVGGWAVGSTCAPLAVTDEDDLVWNTHAGLKVNNLGIVASGQPIIDLVLSMRALQEIVSSKNAAMDQSDPERITSAPGSTSTVNIAPLTENAAVKYPVRLRADVMVRKASVTLVSQDCLDREAREVGHDSVVVMWTVLASLEECPYRAGAGSVQAAVTGVSILRSSDELHLLEPMDVLLKGHLDLRTLKSDRSYPRSLKLSVDSPWNEVAVVMHRHGWDGSGSESTCDTAKSLSILTTATKIHISAQVCAFFTHFLQSLTLPHEIIDSPKQGKTKSTTSESHGGDGGSFRLAIAVRSIDLILFREPGTKSIDPFSSFVFANMEVSLQKNYQSMRLNAKVSDVLVYDRSFRPGVCVVARKYYRREHENPDQPNRDFIAADIQVSESSASKVVTFDLQFGKIKFTVLPSMLQGLLGFLAEVKTLLRADNGGRISDGDQIQKEDNKGTMSPALLSNNMEFMFSFVVDGFECMLPSKELASYIRDHAHGPINVVSLRWKSRGEAKFILSGFDAVTRIRSKLTDLAVKTAAMKGDDEFEEFVDRCAAQVSPTNSNSRLLASNIQLTVHSFQVLRTCIQPHSRSEKDISPFYFKISPPTAGEQLITNSFDFNVAYFAYGSRICLQPREDSKENGSKCEVESSVEFGHALRVEAQLVDVLLYIAQSPGGINDSMRVSVAPILKLLKTTDNRDPASNCGEPGVTTEPSQPETNSLSNVIRKAPVICSIKADGIRVTCVPGGATRLTESPIINFSLRNFALGLAICPVPVEAKLLDTSLEGLVENNAVLSGFRKRHLMAGAWLRCELSASYHNRRLVAWEPFIEPWTMEVRFGADLVKLLKLPPLSDADHSAWQSELERGEMSAYTSERLRNFFRAPFSRSIGSEKEAEVETSTRFTMVGSDMGYLLLALSSKSLVASALHPSVPVPIKSSLTLKDLTSFLPSRNPMKWLVCFGHPLTDDTKSRSKPSFCCSVSDTKPLNVNVTGALIENVLGYLKQEKSRTVAPHWIRNDSGLTIRFKEVLEAARTSRGERASKVTLSNGSEVPLSLKRTLSQSSDPHRAYIMIELGSFEDTVGRIDHQELDIRKGSSLSSLFFYRVFAKVPVDTVGVHRYPLDRNIGLRSSSRKTEPDSRSLGWLIVRVALQGGIKVVSVESPLALKNDTDADLLCEVRANDGLSLLWRCLVPKPHQHNRNFVPVDIVPYVNDSSYEFKVAALPRTSTFSHESELTSSGGRNAIRIRAPPPYSQASLTRGLINEIDVTFKAFGNSELARWTEQVHLNICSLRIGMFDASQLRSTSTDLIPEQRMLLFRSPLAVRNYLAFTIAAQVRVKKPMTMNLLSSDSLTDAANEEIGGWEDLGVLDCGEAASWTGALSMDQVEIRVRFVPKTPETSRRFVEWSSIGTVPPMNYDRRGGARADSRSQNASLAKLRVLDTSGLALDLSLAIDDGSNIRDANTSSIKQFSSQLAPASRVVSLFVPFWIVDSTAQDLEFSSKRLVAGQFDSREDFLHGGDTLGAKPGLTMGLAELLEDAKLSHLPSKSSFSVLLLGDDRSKKLSIRQRVPREEEERGMTAPWSEAISLRSADNRHSDVTIMPPQRDLRQVTLAPKEAREPYALRSRIVSAPEKFGGKLGTKLVHLVCRYAIVNELGREIEIIAEHSQSQPVLVRADGRPKPFHFDDSGPIQFRPREFGWVWSGRFYIRSDRREAVLRIRHKLKRHTIIVTAEIHNKQKSGMCIIVFKAASHPPFRFENNTMHPLQFVQTFLATNDNDILHNREVASSETVLLPYHHEDFAWDEPEHRRKSVKFEIADFGNAMKQSMLGRFNLDEIAPGTELKVDSPLFIAQVLADGPTRVLRISESSMPELPRAGNNNRVKFSSPDDGSHVTFSLNVKLTHGIGVSVIDWSPQELLFLRLEEISVSQRVDASKQRVDASIGRISIDNQLWISPYPVLLEMGSRKLASTLAQIARRKNRRHRAVSVSLCRPLISASLYGDLTLLEWLEVVTDPVNVYVDGNLAIYLSRMMQQIIALGSEGEDSFESRNSTLCKVLSIPESSEKRRKSMMETTDIYSAGDAVATAALAAKARSTRDSLDADSTGASFESNQPASLAKTRLKCYVEKLRISTTKLEISWSGSLAFLPLPRLMPLSLTFEGLPLLLRPYSSSHAYGTVEDHVQSLKSHYLSVWRILDLLLGLAFKPTFLVNAVLYTWSESIASTLGSISRRLAKSKETILLTVREAEPQPTYEDGRQIARTPSLQRQAAAPFLRLLSWWLRSAENVTGFGATLLRYDPTKYSGVRRRKAGIVRTRNPRLFANVDGKDLLVEYSEGENAGKALLSRIRMGTHLGEGYLCHVEGLYQKVAGVWSNSIKLPGTLILMMTFERVVLVNGDLSRDFCSVVWEVTFGNLIHVETAQSEDAGFELLTIWYLANKLDGTKNERYAKSLVADSGHGLDNLLCTKVYVPHGHVKALMVKAQEAKKMLYLE